MLNITIKMLTGETFPITVDPSKTVGEIKAQIAELKAFPLEGMKLIFAGAVLTDAQVLSATTIKDNDFVVCVVKKAAAAPKPVAAPAPAPAAVTPAPAAVTPAPATVAPAPAPSAAPVAAAPTIPAVSPFEDAETVANLTAMGFAEPEARAALRAAYGNAERAVEYLMTGIPDSVLSSMSGGAPASTGTPPVTSGAPAPAPATAGSSDPLAVLRSHPQLNQLKRLVQSNPSALPVVLEQIGKASPQLLTVINSNREAFVALLNEPIGDASGPAPTGPAPTSGGLPSGPGGMDPRMLAGMIAAMPPEQRAALAASMGVTEEQLGQVAQMMASGMIGSDEDMGDDDGDGEGGPVPPGATVIRLTEAEAAAVERLQSLGFSRNQAIEAYLACDKNEQLAANFLLENM